MGREYLRTVTIAATLVFVTTWIALNGGVQTPTFYLNCDDARAAGVTPIAQGQPGYRAALDADDDGIACEAAY